MNIPENPRLKVRNTKTTKQRCIVCNVVLAKEEEGEITPTRIISLSNKPGCDLALSKNLMVHVDIKPLEDDERSCAEILADQLDAMVLDITGTP